MINEKDISKFLISIEMVLKDLRKKRGLSQSNANLEFEEQYGFAINFGRIESNPNYQMTTFLYICDFYNITIEEFSIKVLNKTPSEISRFIAKKKHKKENKAFKK